MHLSQPTRFASSKTSAPEAGVVEPAHAIFHQILITAGKDTPSVAPPKVPKASGASRANRSADDKQAGSLDSTLQSLAPPKQKALLTLDTSGELTGRAMLEPTVVAVPLSSNGESDASSTAQQEHVAKAGQNPQVVLSEKNSQENITLSAQRELSGGFARSMVDVSVGSVDTIAPQPAEKSAISSNTPLLDDQQVAFEAPASLVSSSECLPAAADPALKSDTVINVQEPKHIISRTFEPSLQMQAQAGSKTASANSADLLPVLRTVDQVPHPSAAALFSSPVPAEVQHQFTTTGFGQVASSALAIQEADFRNHSQLRPAGGIGKSSSLLESQVQNAAPFPPREAELRTGAANQMSFAAPVIRSKTMAPDPANAEETSPRFSADIVMPLIISSAGDANSRVQVVAAYASIPTAMPTAQPNPQAAVDARRPESDPAVGTEYGPKTPLIQSAKLIQNVSESEMRVGIHSLEFGNISIRTSVVHQGISAQIMLDHDSLGQALRDHIPAMQARLREEYGVTSSVAIHGQSVSSSGPNGEGSPDADARQEQRASGLRTQAFLKSADSKLQTLGAAFLGDSTSSGRLSIRI